MSGYLVEGIGPAVAGAVMVIPALSATRRTGGVKAAVAAGTIGALRRAGPAQSLVPVCASPDAQTTNMVPALEAAWPCWVADGGYHGEWIASPDTPAPVSAITLGALARPMMVPAPVGGRYERTPAVRVLPHWAMPPCAQTTALGNPPGGP